MRIYEDIKSVKGIGDKTANLLNKLGIYTVEDLLFYYPRTYAFYEPPAKFNESIVGKSNAFVVEILDEFILRKGNRISTLTGKVSDGINTANITFFNTPYLKKTLIKGTRHVFYGKLVYEHNRYAIDQPKVYKIDEYNDLLKSLWPIYSLTKGLSNKLIQKSISQIINEKEYPSLYNEYLPSKYLDDMSLISRKKALFDIHFPQNENDIVEARKRLAFDELFIFLYSLKLLRNSNIKEKSDYVFIETAKPIRLIESLPYKLTSAQIKAYEAIKEDLTSNYVMNRMIQGDVGSGKTIIAFLSLILCADNGYQGALMAPTELLAQQHYKNLYEFNEKFNLGLKIGLLTGSTSAKNKKIIYEQINKHEIDIIIGTHALIQEKVNFNKLALVVTDEQHRFGVLQRQTLAQKGINAHVLVMSATPIPRSLAMVLYGDIHLSIIDEKPSNRLPIKNCVVGPSYRNTAYNFIQKEIQNGHQIYIICPMIEDDDELLKVENVIDYTNKIKSIFPDEINIAMLHGKMKQEEKNNIMNNFANHNIDILVSTTVIEVGIDVPNATVMMVEDAQRFGLAQLHQLRGRVGRGLSQSYCIFINSDTKNTNNKRLQILNDTNDGFEVAKQDLKLRGAGDIFGIRQSGEVDFKIADIYADSDMILKINGILDDYFDNKLVFESYEIDVLNDYLSENKEKYVDFNSI